MEDRIKVANHLQLSMIAHNLNCWLALFEREVSLTVPELTHRAIATNRLRLLYPAARITRHGRQTEIRFGARYQERYGFEQLMARLRSIKKDGRLRAVGPHAASRIKLHAR